MGKTINDLEIGYDKIANENVLLKIGLVMVAIIAVSELTYIGLSQIN